MSSSNHFVDRVRHAMDNLGFSQREFAAAVGVSQGTVSGWLNGAKPHGTSLKALADYLAVRPEWLTGTGGDPSQSDLTPSRPKPEFTEGTAFVLLAEIAAEHRRKADQIEEFLRQRKFSPAT